jgi:hypothetical protein
MKIERNGAERDHGTYDTRLNIKSIAWNSDHSALLLKAYYVPDFATNARHHWEISLTPEEIADVLKAFSVDAAENKNVRKALTSDIVKPLLELALVACRPTDQALGKSAT